MCGRARGVADHALDFDPHALILDGAIVMAVTATTCRRGKACSMSDGHEHGESVGPEDVRSRSAAGP